MIDLRAWLAGLDPTTLHISTFGLLFLEGAGIPGIPGVLPMMAQVGLIDAGKSSLEAAIFWGTLGNWLGSIAGYSVGRWGGRYIPDHWHSRMNNDQARTLLRRYGPLTIVASRTVGALRTPVTLGAGALHYPLPAYVLFSLLGALIHIGVWQWLLWRFGTRILPYLEQVGAQVLMGAAALAALALLGRWLWQRRQPSPAAEAAQESQHSPPH
ncbi:DedA family protein [Deinococcus radiophilus]|uniref:DedA family protein n=1 Tax=Deinococcus radiophilus TaxID=32062 RepID=A0A3S0KJC5_9DEIO|nr:DedA family protein [Deinococcus radiophilus]RTR27996.1 DedA family protein [Deinococcus radiophilus]UFA51557.1 DedA family protein [Deinococcus radiophilus]